MRAIPKLMYREFFILAPGNTGRRFLWETFGYVSPVLFQSLHFFLYLLLFIMLTTNVRTLPLLPSKFNPYSWYIHMRNSSLGQNNIEELIRCPGKCLIIPNAFVIIIGVYHYSAIGCLLQ